MLVTYIGYWYTCRWMGDHDNQSMINASIGSISSTLNDSCNWVRDCKWIIKSSVTFAMAMVSSVTNGV